MNERAPLVPELVRALQAAKGELKFWSDLNSSTQMAAQDWQDYQQTAVMQQINEAINRVTGPPAGKKENHMGHDDISYSDAVPGR